MSRDSLTFAKVAARRLLPLSIMRAVAAFIGACLLCCTAAFSFSPSRPRHHWGAQRRPTAALAAAADAADGATPAAATQAEADALLSQGTEAYMSGDLTAAERLYGGCAAVSAACACNLACVVVGVARSCRALSLVSARRVSLLQWCVSRRAAPDAPCPSPRSVLLDLRGDGAAAEALYRQALVLGSGGDGAAPLSDGAAPLQPLQIDAAQNLASLLQSKAQELAASPEADARAAGRVALVEAATLYDAVVRADDARWDAWANLGAARREMLRGGGAAGGSTAALDAALAYQRAILLAEQVEAEEDAALGGDGAALRAAIAEMYHGLGALLGTLADAGGAACAVVAASEVLLLIDEADAAAAVAHCAAAADPAAPPPPAADLARVLGTAVRETSINCLRTAVQLDEVR